MFNERTPAALSRQRAQIKHGTSRAAFKGSHWKGNTTFARSVGTLSPAASTGLQLRTNRGRFRGFVDTVAEHLRWICVLFIHQKWPRLLSRLKKKPHTLKRYTHQHSACNLTWLCLRPAERHSDWWRFFIRVKWAHRIPKSNTAWQSARLCSSCDHWICQSEVAKTQDAA